jgi:glycosyltransferase involved in cell wall biosynthesis
MEKISVIVPLHNPPLAQFRLCLKSLAEQLYDNFEVILVDDGSNDKSYRKIVSEYESQFKNLLIITQDHQGVGKARNKGIQTASGDFIAFCDCDDFLSDNYLYNLRKAIQGVDLAICGVTEQFYSTFNSLVDMHIFSSFPSYYNYVQYVNFSVNKLYIKSIIDDNHIAFDESVKLGEDAVFLAAYFAQCRRIRTIEDKLYHYLPNAYSAVHTYYPEYWAWESEVIRLQLEIFEKYPLNPREQQFMQHWLFNKIRGAVNYYVDIGHINEDSKQREQVLSGITSSDIFKKLMDNLYYNDNPFLSQKDKRVLWIWQHFGLRNSVKIKKYMKLANRFIH